MRELIVTRTDDNSAPNQEYRDLKQSEITKIENDRAARIIQNLPATKKRALDKELHKKGWLNMADFMSELFDKGFDTMKAEFDGIKSEVDSRFQ